MAETVTRHVSGPVLFARYAFPPNHLGYCGPDDSAGFFTRGVSGDDSGLRQMAQDFDGALPFLELIAAGAGLSDALDPAVVEAYWIGSELLERADTRRLPPGTRPHHACAVFFLYPWAAMLPDERRRTQALTVLDRCRIRWGRVLAIEYDHAVVESAPLVWLGTGLGMGPETVETVRRSIDGIGLPGPLAEGDRVALHWDWLCDVITTAQQDALVRYSDEHVRLVNERLGAGHG